MKAASGTLPVSTSKSKHASISPNENKHTNATLFLPFSLATSASCINCFGFAAADANKSWPLKSPERSKQAVAKSSSPVDIASSPSCFHLLSPTSSLYDSMISFAMPSSPSCTASSNLKSGSVATLKASETKPLASKNRATELWCSFGIDVNNSSAASNSPRKTNVLNSMTLKSIVYVTT